ncbi:phosphatidylserine/phosphatidylglycerophosphate/cardiolipin synthase family protein [Paraconexibacter antarcticus]|uniref:phospholipase D n=1 Tax=Paraconexibacter antarcticus TaxID=2949664 RepID=A0ABY5DWL2_9ACTN|nr:phosphatidylserine/phosphatidylglycerophosphate/cardiolipin synthase family protein [Paraconexibacter antarcticus]UTI66395.1 phosphatidylserine/phosphatidylglycerophosphate/cardiolipin synthase family protein [Paraconexibacter antarcticus]
MTSPIKVATLTQGGQDAEQTAAMLIGFLGLATTSLDLALYDVRLPGTVGDGVADALRAARDRGVAVRIAYNGEDEPSGRRFPPPPRTVPEILAGVGVPLRPIPGEPDLMHHKYVVRDGEAVWTGSANWTLDSWTLQENAIVTLRSPAIAAAYARDFAALWDGGHVQGTGDFDVPPVEVGSATVRAWFCPGRGEALSHRIAKAIGAARTRVRIASPVLTAGPILGTLAEVVAERRADIAGVCDATQVQHVFSQWRQNPASAWKAPLLARVLVGASFTGKRSTPYGPGSVHDFMHAKVTVADDTAFVGSFNLSRSGELNAENVLEIRDHAVADRLAAYVDALRAAYPDPVDVPAPVAH